MFLDEVGVEGSRALRMAHGQRGQRAAGAGESMVRGTWEDRLVTEQHKCTLQSLRDGKQTHAQTCTHSKARVRKRLSE